MNDVDLRSLYKRSIMQRVKTLDYKYVAPCKNNVLPTPCNLIGQSTCEQRGSAGGAQYISTVPLRESNTFQCHLINGSELLRRMSVARQVSVTEVISEEYDKIRPPPVRFIVSGQVDRVRYDDVEWEQVQPEFERHDRASKERKPKNKPNELCPVFTNKKL